MEERDRKLAAESDFHKYVPSHAMRWEADDQN
jgi:hypothetical protein